MLQILPGLKKGMAYQDFEHCTVLAASLQDNELLDIDPEVLLHRLYVEDDITLFSEKAIEFGCNCSRTRMEGIVLGLGLTEALSILEEFGFVEIVCEFCSQAHAFDQDEINVLFSGGTGLRGMSKDGPRPNFNA